MMVRHLEQSHKERLLQNFSAPNRGGIRSCVKTHPNFLRHFPHKRGFSKRRAITHCNRILKARSSPSSFERQSSDIHFLFALRLSLTASARPSRTSTVVSQLMQASVMLTPVFRPDGPSGGTFWLPSLMLDSIMTPIIDISPARSCSPMTFATFG